MVDHSRAYFLLSGVAEFYGVVKASSVALGYQAMMEDLGPTMGVRGSHGNVIQ